MCQCRPGFKPQKFNDGTDNYWCVAKDTEGGGVPDAYYDPTLFGIMGALAIMFIVMCVVLQLFAKWGKHVETHSDCDDVFVQGAVPRQQDHL